MTTIPVERKKIESWLTGLQCGVISQRHVFEELRALLSEQPQADHSAQDLNMVEQPQAGAGQAPVLVEAVAVTKEDDDGELYLDWLIEGGICALESAGTLLLVAHGKVTDDEGGGEVYTAPQPPARHDQGDEVRRLREALEAIQSRASNLMDDELFDMCDAALTQSPKGEEE